MLECGWCESAALCMGEREGENRFPWHSEEDCVVRRVVSKCLAVERFFSAWFSSLNTGRT